jgi:hypothetical protein
MSITFDMENLPEKEEAILVYSHADYGGSVYKVVELLGKKQKDDREVWLCPVLTYFFNEPPEKLYVWVNEYVDKVIF